MAYLEILIAAIAAFALGFGWYTAAFGKAWQAETGLTSEQAQSNMAMTHGLAFLMMCVIAYAINTYVNYHDPKDQTFIHGGMHGALFALYYALPVVAIHYLYQRKSLKLYLIDAGYVLAFMALQGGVLAVLKLG